MIKRASSAAAIATASIFLLAGCAFGGGGTATVSSDDIADLTEEWLEDDIDDSSWKVNCDDDDEEVEVALEEDESIDCLATDKDSDDEFDAEVTITDVDGEDFEVEVELDDEANNSDDDEDSDEDADEDEDSDSDSDGDTYFVSAEDLAALVVEALAPELGYEPTDMECDSEQTEIYEGNWDFCSFTDEAGDYQLVDVTIDSFDKDTGDYTITAEVF